MYIYRLRQRDRYLKGIRTSFISKRDKPGLITETGEGQVREHIIGSNQKDNGRGDRDISETEKLYMDLTS